MDMLVYGCLVLLLLWLFFGPPVSPGILRARRYDSARAQPDTASSALRPWAAPVRLAQGVRRRVIQRYLHRNQEVVLDVLRQDRDLAADAMRTVFEMDAATESPKRSTFQFPQLTFYGGAHPLARTLPKLTPFAIRKFSEYPPSRRAINALSNPILDLPWEIVVRPKIITAKHEGPAPLTADQENRIRAGTNMLACPNNEMAWREFLEMILEDTFTFGAGPFEVQENTSDDRPLFLWPVDVQSIRLNAAWQYGSEGCHYSQARGQIFSSFGTTDDVYLADKELCYPRLNPRTHTPFGLGYLEVAFSAVNAFIGAFEYAERRASNNTPNFGIFLGENVTIDQVRTWQHYWENEIEGYGKVPILGGGRQPSVFNMQGTGQDQLWLSWQEFLIRVIAMAFGLSPLKLGLERDVNRNTASTQAENDWATISPVANLLRDTITYWLFWRRLGWTDLEFRWVLKLSDEEKQANVLWRQYEMNAATVDEIRQVYDRPPLPDGLGQHTKAAYEALFKGAAGLSPGTPGAEDEQDDPTTTLSPFGEDQDSWSASERAFMREMLQERRSGHPGLLAVAT